MVFDLAEEQDYAHDFRESYQDKGYTLLITPTVVAEIYFFLEHGDEEEARLATISVQNIGAWDLQGAPMSDVQTETAGAFAAKLRRLKLLPPEEVNDSWILGEAAVLGIPLVVSSDQHLLGIDVDQLRTICVNEGIYPVMPASPRGLLRAIR